MGWDDEVASSNNNRSRLQPAVVTAEDLSNNIVGFHEALNSISQQLATPSAKMNERAQQKLKNDRENAKQLLKTIHAQLQNPPTNMNRQRLDKLQRDFKVDMARYDQLTKQSISKDKDEIRERKQSLDRPGGGGFGDVESGSRQQEQAFSYGHARAVTEEMLIREKNEEIKALERDLVEVNQLMKDVSVLVSEQQGALDSIEGNVEATAVHVQQGNTQLRKAGEHQKSSRKKMCCLAILLLIIIIILAVVLGVLKP